MEGKPEPEEINSQASNMRRPVKAVGKSGAWLFTALRSIGDAVIATDPDGFIVFMNPVAETLTGWSAEEAEGQDCRKVFRIVNEATRHETESPVTKVMRDGVISGSANHTILISRDGKEYSIDDSGSPIRDNDGHLMGIVLIFRDVTDRRKNEIVLQEQKAILQTLFDHLPVIVTFLDEAAQFKWFNNEWMRVIGWSLEEMRVPERLHEFYSYLPNVPTTAPLSVQLASIGWRECQLKVKDGRLLHLSWSTVRLSDGTSIGIGQDITERKRSEAVKHQRLLSVEARNRRLEQAMKETDHRVKNNLQQVAALLDMQMIDHAEAVPLSELMQVRMHILTVASVHDLLVQDIKGEKAASLLSIRHALEKLLPMLQKVVGEERIMWTVADVRLPIKQGMSLAVLINELVTNAVKHGGRRIELTLGLTEGKMTLVVCDDGPGFTEAFHPNTAAQFGLELVESVGRLDLGGQTSYSNRPEGGACVQVTFPLPAGAAA